MRISPLALVAGCLSSAVVTVSWGQAADTAPKDLAPSRRLMLPPSGQDTPALPILLRAQTVQGQPDLQTSAQGNVELRRGGLVVRADSLVYDQASDTAKASGQVRVFRNGAVYTGPELQLSLQQFEGYFLQPTFEFLTLDAGGRADRVDFLGSERAKARNASYTSCPRVEGVVPGWQLQTDAVTFDLQANEGLAEGARLRFLGTTLLALPVLSFPLSDARKSGWLPPTVSVDNRSGIELAVPYYWNIAPNRDATLVPRVMTRRGLGLDTEFRYLEPGLRGSVAVNWLPNDRVADRSRAALLWQHEGTLPGELEYRADVARVSDNDWWKDFANTSGSLSARLLPTRLALERRLNLGFGLGQGLAYARVAQWQVLQAAESPLDSPYERTPQVGLRFAGQGGGWEWGAETEFNRFTLPSGQSNTVLRTGGDRWHLLGTVARPWRAPGWWVVPRMSVNAAAYGDTVATQNLLSTAQPRTLARATRVIPSFSVDAGLEFERSTQAFGRALHQTLEPRVFYVNTPYRDQSGLPNYDSAGKDFNFSSIYTDSAFTGVDRVSDAHQITAGFTTRLVDTASGVEALRLGLVQRYLLRTQRVTAQADGAPDGEPLTQRFSDVLLLGSTSVLPGWGLSAAVQYSPDISRSVRSILSATYSPGRLRTVSTTYSFARGLSEQADIGWQWPIWGAAGAPAAGPRASGGCSGTWYSVGRVSYSLKERRITGSLLGLEYDAGCWIARVVATQLSTSRNEATTRLGIQLELTGFSKLNVGANPLKVLKDNIPGYQLLREDRGSASSPSVDRLTVSPFYE
jgi:LPS-assembly protein